MEDLDIIDLDVPEQVDPLRLSLDYLHHSFAESQVKQQRSRSRDQLVEWILENGEEDENGNFRYYFPKTVTLFEKPYSGLMAQRRVSESVNEDVAMQVAQQYNVLDEVLDVVTSYEINLDRLYACNQRGDIPDEAIDSIFDINETFALIKIEE